MDKKGQMMQSNDTKTMNLNKDFGDLLSKAQQTGWNGVDQNNKILDPRMESFLLPLQQSGSPMGR